jgi:hypothetical protein
MVSPSIVTFALPKRRWLAQVIQLLHVAVGLAGEHECEVDGIVTHQSSPSPAHRGNRVRRG